MGAFCCKRNINVPPPDFPNDLNTIIIKYLYGDFFIPAVKSIQQPNRQTREHYINWLYVFYRGSAAVHGLISTPYGWCVYRKDQWHENTFLELSNEDKIRTVYPDFSLQPGTVSREYIDKTFASIQNFLIAKLPDAQEFLTTYLLTRR